MSQYAKAVAQLAEQRVDAPPARRTDYRCMANGCPNAGTFDDKFGVARSGKCYAHWREPDVAKWDAVTARVRAKFHLPVEEGGTRNWDPEPMFGDEQPPDRLRGLPSLRNQDPRDWARRLQRREEGGEALTEAQRAMWRDAVTWMTVEASKSDDRSFVGVLNTFDEPVLSEAERMGA